MKLTNPVRVELAEIVDNDLEGFLDLLSEKHTRSNLLMDIDYKIVGYTDDALIIEVSGDYSAILNEEESP
jgi:hypothetical protein